jgi:hypothetical protein
MPETLQHEQRKKRAAELLRNQLMVMGYPASVADRATNPVTEPAVPTSAALQAIETALASLQPSVSEMRLLRDSVLFAVWAAGEGITPADSEGVRAPEDFLMDFSNATGEEGWETLADRLPALSPEGEP